ncbi:MAG: fibronectin type III domain-containing protein [Saprospiraceae bacterium]|nr:fibronectin type III domain-containing protein [Saprospiraceae bacterium]
MLCLKNRLLAIALLWGLISLSAQNITTIQVNSQDPVSISPVASQVMTAKNQQGSFYQSKAVHLSSLPFATYRGQDASKLKLLEPNLSELRSLLKNKPSALSLEIPVDEREIIVLDLVRVDLFAEGFQVFTSDGSKAFPYVKGVYYRGVVQGQESGSLASISIFENEIIGSFTVGEGNIVIQPTYDAPGQMILYNDRDINTDIPFECLTDELQPIQKEMDQRGVQAAGDCVRVYIECDYALHNNKGGVTNTTNWITSVFNNVKTLYANESINTAISEVFVWTSEDGYSKTSSVTALNQFKTKRPTFNGDLAHLAALGGNNIGGVAWLDVLCSSYRYAYSNISSTYSNVPTYSWTVEVMTHEMGHNLGSNHTHWCGWPGGAIDNCYTTEGGCAKGPAPPNGGTIMSYCHLTNYGINFNNGFGPLPGDKIRSEVASATCLGQSCGGGGGCNAPTGLNITNITQTTATANWNTVTGATSYKFEYKTNSGGTWTVVTTTNPTYNMTGLTAGTLYNTRVKAVCASGESTYSATVNFTTNSSGGSCNTPTNLAASNITETTATVSWSPVSGANSYNFQYKLASSNTWYQVNVTTTAVNLTGMSPNTNYNVRVQAVCSGGNSAFTSTLTFKTLAGYCTSKGNNANYEWVARVKIGTIDRVSGTDGGYYNGTSLVTDVTKGTTYTFNHQIGTTGSSGNIYRRVWIDFNNNKSFNDAGEQVLSQASSSTALQSANITIPAGAATAQVRMRVAIRYGGYPTSCQTFAYGEVEDYSINIKAAGSLIDPNQGTALDLESIQITPNPFDQNLQVSFFSTSEQRVQLNILDQLGRVVNKEQLNATEGINIFHLNTASLNPASYYIRLVAAGNQHTRKLIKLE